MLQKYGFSDKLISWIRLFYTRPQCQIINNYYLSKTIDIRRVVRRGDPLSPSLFIPSVECLANLLRVDTVLHGIIFNSYCCKVSLFADDLTIYLNGNIGQFERVFQILQTFANFSGCKINFQKSQAFHFGANKNMKQKPFWKRIKMAHA